MATPSQAPVEPVPIESQAPHWNLATRIFFRFCFLYFGLYCLTNQVLQGLFPIPNFGFPDLGSSPPMRQIVFWAAAHIFQVSKPLVYMGSGSGDKTFDWVLTFSVLSIAAVCTAIWTVFDRRRENYISLHKWFHLFLRFAVGSEMLIYGFSKVVPLQMPFPFLTRLVEPFGNFSPMGVLWYSIGASPGYEIFAGAAETLGGVLLFIPRTSTLGALVCLADATEVFMLNMTYDVPVKLLSFHLILMSLVLLAPEFKRLVTFFFSTASVSPSRQPKLFRSQRANRVALVVQVAFGLVLIGTNLYMARANWFRFGGGSPKSPLFGIWNMDQLWVGGQPQPLLVTDKEYWKRVIFDRPGGVAFQRADDTFITYGVNVNTTNGLLSLTKGNDKNWRASLKFERVGQDQLTLDGQMDGRALRMHLQLLDRDKLPLLSRGFHWIQEYPFNR